MWAFTPSAQTALGWWGLGAVGCNQQLVWDSGGDESHPNLNQFGFSNFRCFHVFPFRLIVIFLSNQWFSLCLSELPFNTWSSPHPWKKWLAPGWSLCLKRCWFSILKKGSGLDFQGQPTKAGVGPLDPASAPAGFSGGAQTSWLLQERLRAQPP